MADMEELVAKMKVLSEAYATQLPEKFAQLEQAWKNIPADVWDDEKFGALHRMVHSFSGSGKTFGFAALSEVARVLEAELKVMAQAKAILTSEQRGKILGLMTELHQVVLTAEPSQVESLGLASNLPMRLEKMDGRRVIIVDDDVPLAELMQSQLVFFGYDISVFHSLSEFSQAISQGTDADPIVLMDVSFPEDVLGGVHVMQKMQLERETPLQVIFLSANSDLDARLEAVRAGGIAFFNKPFNMGALIDQLDQLTSTQPQSPYRVLIIDDSVSLTTYYCAVLQQAGMEVKAVNDPLKMMEPLLSFDPDLILIDIYMPGCDGMELARVIRQIEDFVSIPIVFLSGEKDLDKQMAAMNLGADDFLTKPIQPQHLVVSVRNRIRRSMVLRSFMIRDSLTGLLNHTAIKDQLDREVARAKRQGTPFCFAMVDIDFFKKVNDTYGHPVGDRVIKSLSRLLKQRLRENDAVGRYGGEEFAVILADVDGATAALVMDKIREDFSRLMIEVEGKKFSATFSCGIADISKFNEATKLCDAADKALYQAKHAGRNQVAVATP